MVRWAAEWEKQEAIVLSFPHRKSDWPYRLKKVEVDFAQMVKSIADTERIVLLVQDVKHLDYVKNLLNQAKVNLSSIDFVLGKTNRSWMRDTSPIYVFDNKERLGVCFEFRAWAKYDDYNLDAKVQEYLSKHTSIKNKHVEHKGVKVSLEGGAIDGNGSGSLITTEECLLDSKIQIRNKGFGKVDYETIFKDNLGCSQTIWLESGILGDDTHGHIDDVCKFINEDTVVLALAEDISNPNYKITHQNREKLQGIRLQNGNKLKVVTLPLPKIIKYQEDILPASYINSLFGNEAIFVPTFEDENDKKVLGLLNEIVPDRKVIGVNCKNIILGLGAIHCLSSQIPVIV